MRLGLFARTLLATALLVVSAASARADDKPLRGVALVIGQAKYEAIEPLGNPPNDAAAMAELLTRLGFEVTPVTDAGVSAMASAVDAFVGAAKGADVALIYYSGHGIEAGGENYLVPIDADISTPVAAGETLLPLSGLLDRLAEIVPVTVVLLDACRTGVFPDGTLIQPPGAAEAVAIADAGLAATRGPMPVATANVDPESFGMVIGFAASPGQPALDGAPGENSPYAAALLKHLGAGGYSFGDVMTLVGEEVYLKTKARQLPWVNSSLRRILSFGAPLPVGDTDVAAIADGRRRLLLSIAGAPEDTRATVEAVADSATVPLDQVYGMLEALGIDTTDPNQLKAQLEGAAERVRRLNAEPVTPIVLGGEPTRLAELAIKAEREGAFREALDLRLRAIEATRETVGFASSGPQKAQLAALLAAAAETQWTLFDLDNAAANYAEAEGLVEDFDVMLGTHYKKLRADALAALGEFKGDQDSFEQSLALYDEVLTYYDDQPDDDVWADAANDFGIALAKYGERHEDDTYLNDAVSAFIEVLGVWSRDAKPDDWARTQNNIGNAYASLGDRTQNSDLWVSAATAYREALEVWTRAHAPLDWARAQNNLGTTQHTLGNYEGDADKLEASIEAYHDALEEWTRERSPYDWAIVQNNLGNAITDLAKLNEDLPAFDEGIAAYNAALEVWTIERLPLDWATVYNNLGATYGSMARLVEGDKAVGYLRKAVDALELCLAQRTEQRDPWNWALTQYNLGLIATDLGERETGTDALALATDAFSAALDVYTEEDAPVDHADSLDGLAWSMAQFGARTNDPDMIREARGLMEESYAFYADYDGAVEYYEARLDQIDAWLETVT